MNVKVSGLVFILSGQLSVLLESEVFELFSAELIFQETTAFLAKLMLSGNGTRLFVFVTPVIYGLEIWWQ